MQRKKKRDQGSLGSGRKNGLTSCILLLVLALVTPTSGCALLASANASHSGISPCVDERVFTLIDLGISIGTAAAVAVSADDDEDASGWAFAIPGIFFASAIFGVVSTERCRHSKRPKVIDGVYQRSGPVLYRSDAPVDDAERESDEHSQPLPPIPVQPVNPLRLPDDYEPKVIEDPDNAAARPEDEAVKCNHYTKFSCPPNHVCVTANSDEGFCKPRKTEAPAK